MLNKSKTIFKPWGKEVWLELNDKYCYKRIYINAGTKTSYQYHEKKLEYQRLRKPEYPKIEDQLDLLYHKGVEGWKEEIQKVKDKYPKPEAPSE